MVFQLEKPWSECVIKTKIGKRIFKAKIDTGAAITIVGGALAGNIGMDLSKILTCPCVVYLGVTGHKGYAFRVPVQGIPVGNMSLPVNHIHIPFELEFENKTCKFIAPDKFIIGMDVLINYNMVVSYGGLFSGGISSASLELTPHGFNPPPFTAKQYKFQDIMNNVGITC